MTETRNAFLKDGLMTHPTAIDAYADANLSVEQKARILEVWNRSRAALDPIIVEMKITQDELKQAAEYFNRLGQSGMFASLLIVGLGMTSLRVNESAAGGTPYNVEGPFFDPRAPVRVDGNLLEREVGPAARRLDIVGKVVDAKTREPLEGATIHVWQADENGEYDNSGITFNLRGKILSGQGGDFAIRTIVPKDYAEHDNDPIGELFRAMSRTNRRAAHVHVKVLCDGYRPLTTQLFVPDAEHLVDDYLEGAVIPELMLTFENEEVNGAIQAHFDFALAPVQATT